MTPLSELLSQRDARPASELLVLLQEGLGKNSALSGSGAATHQCLLDYFRLDARASASSFAAAFKKYPATTQSLLALCEAQGLDTLAGLMQSLVQGTPRPTGAFKQGLDAQAQAIATNPPAQQGVLAALKGFASAAFATAGSEAEIELSLAWGDLEDALLAWLAPHADAIDFQWGPQERLRRQQAQAAQSALQSATAAQLLQAFFNDAQPQVLAQAPEWDRQNAGAPDAIVPIPVHHIGPSTALPAAQCVRWADWPAAAPLLAVYQVVHGAALFCTDPRDVWSAGFLLLPSEQWDAARAEVVQWLTAVDFQDDGAALPAWVHSAIPFGKIPGDASYWILPTEGPFAGQVLLSNDDVSAETSRYASFDVFVATLRVHPELVIGSGGYISYPTANPDVMLYPVGYRMEAA